MESEEQIKNKSIETYAGDMAGAIETGEDGLIKKIIHQQDIEDEIKKNESPESKKNKLFMIFGTLIIILGITTIVLLFVFKENIYSVPVEPRFSPIIFSDKNNFLAVDELKKEEIARELMNEASNTEVKNGGVEAIYLTEAKKVIGFKRFSMLTEGNFPLAGFDLVDENFFIGVLGKSVNRFPGQNGDLFILLKVKSFPDIFPIMRFWEPKMFADLHGIFGKESSTTADFKDEFIENKNARVFRDPYGSIMLMYVFVDDNSIVITSNLETVHEVIRRLASGEIRH